MTFCFYVVFWGDEFRRLFVDYCLSSLMASNNIPALTKPNDNEFLIYTTKDDWTQLNSEPLFLQLRNYVTPVLFEMPKPDGNEHKMKIMSRGHKTLLQYLHNKKVYGIYLAPDMILSDGSISYLQQCSKTADLVLAPALRLCHEDLDKALLLKNLKKPENPITISSQYFSEIIINSLHPELLKFEWEKPYFATYPISCYWRIEEGLLFHTFSWAPALINFAAIDDHNISCLDEQTIDGNYLVNNFNINKDRVCISTSTDQIILAGFTSKYDPTWSFLSFDYPSSMKLKSISRILKLQYLRNIYYSDAIDSLKRELFFIPIKLSPKMKTECWEKAKEEAASVLNAINRESSNYEKLLLIIFRFINFFTWCSIKLFVMKVIRKLNYWRGEYGLTRTNIKSIAGRIITKFLHNISSKKERNMNDS